jgi:hypothetical protein
MNPINDIGPDPVPAGETESEPEQDDIPLAVIEISDELMHAIHRC